MTEILKADHESALFNKNYEIVDEVLEQKIKASYFVFIQRF